MEASLRGQLRAECEPGEGEFLLSMAQQAKWAWPLLLTNPPGLVFLHDVLEPVLRLTIRRCPVFIICPRRGDNRASPNTCSKKPPREPDCLAQGIQYC